MRPTCVSRRRSKVVSRCFGIVLGKTPGTILFMLPQAEAVPCTHSWEPTTAVLLPLSLRTSARTGVAIRFPFYRGTFFPRRKKVPKERRQNQWFWNPFRGQDTARSGTLQPRELSTAKFAPCFRIVSASPSATRSALVLAWRDGGNLCVCRRTA